MPCLAAKRTRSDGPGASRSSNVAIEITSTPGTLRKPSASARVKRARRLENLLVQRQLCHQPLEFQVLPLQVLQSFRLIRLQAAVFFPPAVVRLDGDFNFLAGSRGGLSVRDPYFDLPQQSHDLPRLVPLD